MCPCAICLPQLLHTTSLRLIDLFAKQSRDKPWLMQLTKLKVRLFSLCAELGSFLPTPKTFHKCPSKEYAFCKCGEEILFSDVENCLLH
jgi:hypothetical protein